MAEPGWPLIPREVLPAPVRPAPIRPDPNRSDPLRPEPTRPAAGRAGSPAGRQLSIFGAETTDPSPADLAGLLAGPGRLGRMGGTARVWVRVDAAWRVHVLVAELVGRGLVVHWLPVEDQPLEVRHTDAPPESGVPPRTGGDPPPPDPDATATAADSGNRATADHTADADHTRDPGGADDAGTADDRRDRPGAGVAVFEVRTAYSSRLIGLARAWPAAADQLFLSGPRLRLWVAAAGRPRDGGYALGLDPHKSVATVDSALRRAGLAGSVSEDGLHYLITGRRRLQRLAELVGDRPEAAPAAMWPGGAGA